jgi:ferredoxin
MPLHIEIDRDQCRGYGNCVMAAPDVFDLDSTTQLSRVVAGRPHEDDADSVEEAEAGCPARAIRVTST